MTATVPLRERATFRVLDGAPLHRLLTTSPEEPYLLTRRPVEDDFAVYARGRLEFAPCPGDPFTGLVPDVHAHPNEAEQVILALIGPERMDTCTLAIRLNGVDQWWQLSYDPDRNGVRRLHVRLLAAQPGK